MLVSDIGRVVNSDSEYTFDCPLSRVSVEDDGIHIDDDVYSLDESTTRSLGSLLDISHTYLKKCPPDLAAQNINYWLRQRSESDAMIHVFNGQPRFLKPNMKLIPVKPVTEIISRVFAPDDEVVEFTTTDQLTHIDVISQEHRIEVPGRDVPLRPENDITHGGIRIRITSDYRTRPPEVYSYLNRRVCTNGLTVADPNHKFTLHGVSVEDVLREMETVATELWSSLPDVLQTYRSTADVELPGETAHFVHKLSTEYGIGARVTARVMERVGELPNPPSLFDVINLFTSVANEDITYRTRDSLQMLGGALASHPDSYTHRCSSCMHLLD